MIYNPVIKGANDHLRDYERGTMVKGDIVLSYSNKNDKILIASYFSTSKDKSGAIKVNIKYNDKSITVGGKKINAPVYNKVIPLDQFTSTISNDFLVIMKLVNGNKK